MRDPSYLNPRMCKLICSLSLPQQLSLLMLWFVRTTTELSARGPQQKVPGADDTYSQRNTGTGTSMPGCSGSSLISLLNKHGFYLHFLQRVHIGHDGWHQWVASLEPQEHWIFIFHILYMLSICFSYIFSASYVSCICIISWILGCLVHSFLSIFNIHILYLLLMLT